MNSAGDRPLVSCIPEEIAERFTTNARSLRLCIELRFIRRVLHYSRPTPPILSAGENSSTRGKVLHVHVHVHVLLISKTSTLYNFKKLLRKMLRKKLEKTPVHNLSEERSVGFVT